jgi:hypothetical protein
MEISKIDCGAWLTLQAVDERVGEVRLKLMAVPSEFEFPELMDNKTVIEFLAKFIIDWNLESEGVAVPCTDENKAKYVGYLLRLEVKGDPEKEIAVLPIMRFVADVSNFLKN